jgi:putative ABC transport system permease protein
MLRNLIRSFRARPSYAAAVVLTLALGIGANSAIFSLLDTVFLRPLPYPESGKLAAFFQSNARLRIDRGGFSPGSVDQIRGQTRTLSGFAGYYTDTVSETSGVYPERLATAYVSPRFFDVFRAQLAAGRPFNADEERDRKPQDAVMISYRLWQRRFAGDKAMADKKLRLGASEVSIAGVLPASFAYPNDGIDVWRNTSFPDAIYANPAATFFEVVGRVKPEYSLEQARAEVDSLVEQLDRAYKTKQPGWRLEAKPLQFDGSEKYAPTLWLLFAAVFLLLLLACANVAALDLAHLEARAKELSVRASLGASPSQLTSGLLTEAFALSLAGAALGMVLAQWLIILFRDWAKDVPRISGIEIDSRVALFTLVVACGVTLLFSLLPSWLAAKQSVRTGLSGSTRSYTSSRTRPQQLLVALQFALAIVLVTGGGLLWRSFGALSSAPTGLDTSDVTTFRITAGWGETNQTSNVQSRFQKTLDRLKNIPGVEMAAIAVVLPPSGATEPANFKIGGNPADDFSFPVTAQTRSVSSGYFDLLRIPVLTGETCRDEVRAPDAAPAPQAALVNQAFVDRYLRDRPILDQVLYGEMSNRAFYPMRIQGVVGDVREQGPGIKPAPVVYSCGLAGYYPDPVFLIRSRPGLSPGMEVIRGAVREVSPARAVYAYQTMNEHLRGTLASPRMNAALLGGFGITGLLLAAIGLYAVMSYTVATRRREIGVRLAVGATPDQVRRQFVLWAARILGLGLILGLPGAVLVGRLLRSMLYEVSVLDPLVFFGAPVILASAAALAAYLPARRASAVDPLTSLRSD